MIRLKINPHEFAAMIMFLRRASEGYRQVPLQKQTVDVLVMGQYLAKWNSLRMMVWITRPAQKLYGISLPLPVARALHLDMQQSFLGEFQQLFLNKLDQAIISYQDPLDQAYVIGTFGSQI